MIKIEKSDPLTGYSDSEMEEKDAYVLLNQELENGKAIWIDGKPFTEEVIQIEDIKKAKKEISITNALTGG